MTLRDTQIEEMLTMTMPYRAELALSFSGNSINNPQVVNTIRDLPWKAHVASG
jgi:hypothetical protein